METGVTILQEDEALIIMYSKIRDQDIKMTDRTVLSYVKFSTNQTDWWLLNFFANWGPIFSRVEVM